ncbi:MAG: hypothetical protein LBK99_26680 [Opitutaceae bacterium]|jgi:uncharacterized membrane protein|nr:hypothetical protein [Opitutaceae bacterium]
MTTTQQHPHPAAPRAASGAFASIFATGALAVAFAIALAVAGMASVHADTASAAVSLDFDFENGSADYNNGGWQNSGVWRNPGTKTNVQISDNGAGNNDYLTFSGQAAVIYDTTPADTTMGDIEVFKIAAGQTAVFTTEVQTTTTGTNKEFSFGFINTASSAAASGIGVGLYLNAGNDFLRYQIPRNNTIGWISALANSVGSTGIGDVNGATANTWFRLELTFANNATNTGATLTTNLYQISDFGGTVSATIHSGLSVVITYGTTGTGTDSIIDLNPADTGVSLFLFGQPESGTTFNFDNVKFFLDAVPGSIPEPETTAALVGGFFLVATALLCRRRGTSMTNY